VKGRRHMPAWKTDAARRMRSSATPAEDKLWQALRGRQLCGMKWRRQAPLYGYIADFYCVAFKLVVEVEGDYHDLRKAEDARRDRHLAEKGITTLRFANVRVMTDLSAVLREVADTALLEAA
jgi:very-short-patch-repair endonuclease